MAKISGKNERISGSDFGLPLVSTVGSIRSRSAQRIAWHSHDGFELIFLLDGGTAYQFRDHGLMSLNSGQFLLVPAGAMHRGKQDIRMPSVLCGIVFQPNGPRAARNSTFTAADLKQLARRLGPVPRIRAMSRELRALAARLAETAREFTHGNEEAKLMLRSTVCLMIVEAARLLHAPLKADPTQVAAAAEAFLRRHHADAVQMPDLAEHLGLSRARMHEVFKAATGLSPNDYLQRHRVEVAREMLVQSQRTITDIAMATGFSTSQYFCKVFSKYSGVTPREYRGLQTRPRVSKRRR